MLYEKKMLILSGDGKGVVMIEKSANGVRFSLRTFDMPTCDGLKAGVVTRSAVFVRDLPDTLNPAAVFTVDAGEIDELHFAVFDKSLRLYGTNTKRMWESNLMDLLNKHDRRSPVLGGAPTVTALPPIAQKPRVLPMPDGTGIPQSRLAIYGDEAISDSDFYTPFDIGSRMPEVDSFLDSPRVLDGLAPRVVPTHELPVTETTAAGSDPETTATVEAADRAEIISEESEQEDFVAQEKTAEENTEGIEEQEIAEEQIHSEKEEREITVEQSREEIKEKETTIENTEENKIEAETQARKEAAASGEFAVRGDMPWELTAWWIKNRTKRTPVVRVEQVKKVTPNENVKFLRETEFFERARKDIDILFKNAEKDKTLAELLPDIEWVKVGFDGHVISVGRSGNTFLCYAVEGEYEKNSPLGAEAQWLPLKRNIPTGKGYWLIFQNLVNGEIIAN